jgi:hemoglobin-like flavoprotein
MGSDVDDVFSGDDALIAAADLLYQKISSDSRFEDSLANADLTQLASGLQSLLANVFEGEWPDIKVGSALSDDSFENFAVVLADTLQSSPPGEDVLLQGLNSMSKEKLDDDRLIAFFEHIRSLVIEGEESSQIEDEEGEEVEEDDAAEADNVQPDQDGPKDAVDTGNDVNTKSFNELVLEAQTVQAANDAWRLFISTAESREAAGEAIYAALFEGAPSLQSLFTTPRAVQAMRFMNGLASFVTHLDDPPKLKILVETLGFGHLHLDVTVPRVIIFRDAILDLFMVELAEKFSSAARDGWKKLLNYVGGAIIYVKVHYADRIHTLLTSWKKVNKEAEKEAAAIEGGAGGAEKTDEAKAAAETKATAEKEKDAGHHMIGSQGVPTTYPEMFRFNAAVMGFGQSSWMSEVLACFNNIVTNVSNSARLQEECDVLVLRIARVLKGELKLAEYKSCMLSSLRSLLPKDWDSSHEVAWTWLWENVERLLLRLHGKPPVWEKALGKIISSFDEESKFELRKDIYSRFFTLAPAGQDFFKQSNTYLHFIADKIIGMTVELFENPVKMVDDLSALGLRHVGYAIPTELFGPFVTACVEVLMTRSSDDTAIEAFRWSLGTVSKILVRTITEGSTIVMKVINQNSQKMLRKAISCAPRGERAAWMLLVQVGTQSISPLAWSLESGNFEAALAMLRDLTTFRADRDRYYYGVKKLFKRHEDIVKMLCDQAPDLLPKLLDGLVWRSRLTENGLRRTNYYVRNLLVTSEGDFSPTLKWITQTRDPKIVCHPVIVLVSDLVWSRVAYRRFLYGKSWILLLLSIFITSQSILKNVHYSDDEEKTDGERIATFACRLFIYLINMNQLIFTHCRDSIAAYKKKNTIRLFGCIRIPKYLKQWQDASSLLLMLFLMVMLALEPILWCWKDNDGKLFFDSCEEHRSNMYFSYSLFSMLSMFLYYVLLLDLTVVSTNVSAFVLVCARVISEVGLFLSAIFGCIITFSSAISVLKQESVDFAGIHHGSYSLVLMVLGMLSTDKYAEMRDEPTMLALVFLFLVSTVIFFTSLLVAQLSCAYHAVYADMVGYARLERAQIIVELMPSISKVRWTNFIESLKLNERVEFNAGDIGVSGGIPTKEPAGANPTTVDMIRRFGGSTLQEMQWPEEDVGDQDGEDRFERMEKLIQRTLQRITKSGDHSKRKGTAGGSSKDQSGSKQSGSKSSSESSGEDKED